MMSNKARKIVKRVTALFLALTVVMSFSLYGSSDRVLRATALDDEDYSAPVESAGAAEAESLSYETVEVNIPAPEPVYVPEPEPVYVPEPEPEPVITTEVFLEPPSSGGDDAASGGSAGDETPAQVPEGAASGEAEAAGDQHSDAAGGTGDTQNGDTDEITGNADKDIAGDAAKDEVVTEDEDKVKDVAEDEDTEEDADAEEEDAEEDEDEDKESETWLVTFLDRDNQLYSSTTVEKGKAIGSLPAPVAREDYVAYWAVGAASAGGQGTVWMPVFRISESYVPTEDVTVVPDYDAITYTVTFRSDEDLSAASVLETRTVSADTNYCLNDIPDVPERAGFSGSWAYAGGLFTNLVPVQGNTDVWPVYDQQIFHVRFLVEGETYEEATYYSGDRLTLPSDPVVGGKTFQGWQADGRSYTGGEDVLSDLELHAAFSEQYTVTFIIRAEDSGMPEDDVLVQYFDAGSAVTTLPQTPFSPDRVFSRWVIEGTDTAVSVGTPVTRNMRVVAEYHPFEVYTVTAVYYYLNDAGQRVNFETQIIDVDRYALPYTLNVPASTRTSEDEVKGAPIYYPEVLQVEIAESDFRDGAYSTEVQFVRGSASYSFVYYLKDLDGAGYTEIPGTRENVTGVFGSYVTPTIKDFDYAELEAVESAAVTEASGQEFAVRYTRRDYTLTYESNGGSYVPSVVAPYGTAVALPAQDPAREGYTFGGWYADEALKVPAEAKLTLTADTVLYAAWEGDTVPYTIVYLFEKYNEAGTATSFVYDNSASGTAKVGDVVTPSTRGVPTKTRTGWEADTERNGESSVTVRADGSSVLYVYYRLKTYTFSFNAGTFGSGWSSYNVTATLTAQNVSGTGTLPYSMSVKLGQNISAQWPLSVTGTYQTGRMSGKTSVGFNGWLNSGQNVRYVTRRDFVTADMLPSSGTSVGFTAQWSNDAKTCTVNYWLQNADDDGYTNSDYSQTYSSSSGTLSAKDISGFTYISSKDDHKYSGSGKNATVTEYNFYYDRDTYSIDYFYGRTKLNTVSGVKFDADISSDAFNLVPERPAALSEDYSWGGWYADAGLTTPYEFNEMPAANLALYASWIPPQYTLSFALNGGEGETPAAQTLSRGAKADRPANPVRTGYTFDGWYTTAEGGDLYDWQMPVTQDRQLYAHWNHTIIRYTVHYVDEDGTELVPDRVVTDPANGVGTVVTEQAVTVAGHRPDAGSKSTTLQLGDNEITFVYSGKVEKTAYTVRYLLEDTDYRIAPDKVVEDVDGNILSVLEKAAAVNYAELYAALPEFAGLQIHPDAAQKELILTAKAEQNVLDFIYSAAQRVTVTVNYADMQGNAIPGVSPSVQTLKLGSTFTLGRTPISGWELASAVEGTAVSGPAAGTDYAVSSATVQQGELVFTLFYQKKLTVSAIGARRQYNGEALTMAEELSGQVTAEGLLEGDSLTAVTLLYTQQDGAENEPANGRLNAGVCLVTPADAVLAGPHAAEGYYRVRYISGALEVTRISVTVRIEPDRWTNAVYTGEGYRTGFTNPDKGITDYVRISNAGYSERYLEQIWTRVAADSHLSPDPEAPGLGLVAIAEKDVGDYSYSLDFTEADLPDDPNYSVGLYVRPGRLQILPVSLTVTTLSATKVYDGTPLTALDGAAVAGFVNGETAPVIATGARTEAGVSINSYEILWEDSASTALASNYRVRSENLGRLTVTVPDVTVIVGGRETVYSGAQQQGVTLPETLTGSVEGVTVTGLPAGLSLQVEGYLPAAGVNAGSYTGSFSGASVTVLDAEGNDVTGSCPVTLIPGTLEIAPAPVTVTAVSRTIAYGEPEPVLSALVEGICPGDSESAVTYSLTRTAGVDAGSYAIVPSGETLQGNYTVRFVEGTLTITEAKMALEALSLEKPYDAAPLTGGAKPGTFPAEGTTLAYSLDGGLSWTEELPALTDAGELRYTVRAVNRNYESATAEGILTVQPLKVAIRADNLSKSYGEADPALTAQVEGLLEREKETVALEYSLRRESGEDTGTYEISVEAQARQGNYVVTTVPGTLTIAPSGELSVSATGYAGTYDGASHFASASVNLAEGTTVEFSTDGGATWSADAPAIRDVGTVKVSVRATRPNFEPATATATLIVTPRAVTVMADDLVMTYGGETPTFTASVTGLVEGEDPSQIAYTLALDAEGASPLNAGRYAVSVTAEEIQGNYVVTGVPGTLTVEPARRSIGFADAAKPYDGEPLTGSLTDEVPEGTTVTYSTDGGQTWSEQPPSVTDAGSLHVLVRFENPNFVIPEASGTLTVLRAAVTVTADAKAKTFGSADPELTATVSGYAAGEADSIAYTLSRAPGENVGSYAITPAGAAVQGNYEVSFVPAQLTVSPAGTLTLAVTGYDAPYDGEVHSISASVNDEEGTTVEFSTDSGATWSETAPQRTDAGSEAVLVRAVNPNYETAEAETLLRVTPCAILFTAASATKEYDGTPLSDPGFSQQGSFARGEGADVTVTGSQTVPGSSPNALSYTLREGTNAANYSISVAGGTLSVTNRAAKYEIPLITNSGSVLYDGAMHAVEGFEELSFSFGGTDFRVEGVSASASGTAAGRYPVSVTGTPVVRDAEGRDVTGEFIVNIYPQELEISKRSLVFTSASATADYSGAALTADTVTVTGDGFAEGEGAAFSVTGSQTLVGSSENSFTWTLNAGTDVANYSITAVPGVLTVTNRNAPYELTVVANSDEAAYDGRPHSVSGFRSVHFGIGNEVYTVSGLTASATLTHAGMAEVPVIGTPVVTDSAGNDVSSQFSVLCVPGSLTVTPRALTLYSASASKTYDAIPLTAHSVTVSAPGFAAGDSASYTFTASRTVIGSEENRFTWTFNEGTLASDYVITESFGTLTVVSRADDARFEITVRAGSGEALYDGAEHAVDILFLGDATAEGGAPLSFSLNGQTFTLSGLRARQSAVNAGSYPVNVVGTPYITDAAGHDVSSQFLVLTASGSLTVGQRAVTLTSGSAEHAYTGRELRNGTVTVSGDGFAEGEGAAYTVTGARTLVGESRNEFTWTLNPGTEAANYVITPVYGTLRVTNRDARYTVTLRANSAEAIYDGSLKSVTGLENTGFTLNGVSYTVTGLTASGSGTAAGSYPVTVRGTAAVLDADGNDVSRQFSVVTEPGTLTVRPRSVTLTSATASREYNGRPFSAETVTVSGDGFVSGDGVETWGFAYRILPGSTENSFLWALNRNTDQVNYRIETVFGRLSVTNRDAQYEITLCPNGDDTVFYDGEEHSVSGFEQTVFEIDGNTYTVVDVEAGVTATEAGVWPSVITGEPRVLDENGNDVTDQFAITVEPGYLTIRDTYLLTVRFADRADRSRDLAPAFTGRYAPGESFGPIPAPDVDGYRPEYREVRAPEAGMPEHDLTLVLYYNAIPDPTVPVIPAPVVPQNTEEPVNPNELDLTGDEPDETETEPTEAAETVPPIGVAAMGDYEAGELELMEEPSVPLARAGAGYWALVNLILALLTLLLTILLTIVKYVGRDDEEKPQEENPGVRFETESGESGEETKAVSGRALVLSILITLLAALVFFLTEDLTNTMALIDRWTILMLVIFAVQAFLYWRATHRRDDDDEGDNPENPVAENRV